MLRGATDAGSLACVSTNAGTSFNSLAGFSPWWVQAYLLRDRQLPLELLDSAREAGARAVMLTADTSVIGQKYCAGPSVWENVPPEHLGCRRAARRPTGPATQLIGRRRRPTPPVRCGRRGTTARPTPARMRETTTLSPATVSPSAPSTPCRGWASSRGSILVGSRIQLSPVPRGTQPAGDRL